MNYVLLLCPSRPGLVLAQGYVADVHSTTFIQAQLDLHQLACLMVVSYPLQDRCHILSC